MERKAAVEEMKHCQSCGMPISEESHYGKNADGSKNEDFCCYCYPEGMLASPDETLEEMVESCVPFIVEDGTFTKEEKVAREMLTEFLPTLKRWKKQGMIISFHLKEDVAVEDFLKASDEIQENYLSKCPGFICRQLMLIEGVWTDYVTWEHMGAAESSMHKSAENEAADKFNALIGEVLEYQLYPLERTY